MFPTAKINGSQLLQKFELPAFSMHRSYNPPDCFISEVRDLPPCVLLFWMTKIHFGISSSSFLCNPPKFHIS
jgi:hypothetical protein